MPRTPKPVPAGLLTREQAAVLLGVSVRTLFTLRQEGRLPRNAVVRLATDRQRIFYNPEVLAPLASELKTVRQRDAERPVRYNPKTGRVIPWQ